MLARTPANDTTLEHEQHALTIVNRLNGNWSSETHRKLAASYLAGELAMAEARGFGRGIDKAVEIEKQFSE